MKETVDIYKVNLGEFGELGYTNYCPVYGKDGIANIDIYDDYNEKKIFIDKDGATKEVKEEDEDDTYYSCSALTYEEMKAICSFMEKHNLV